MGRLLQRSSGTTHSELGLLLSTYLYRILSAGDVVSGRKSEGLVNGKNESLLTWRSKCVKATTGEGELYRLGLMCF